MQTCIWVFTIQLIIFVWSWIEKNQFSVCYKINLSPFILLANKVQSYTICLLELWGIFVPGSYVRAYIDPKCDLIVKRFALLTSQACVEIENNMFGSQRALCRIPLCIMASGKYTRVSKNLKEYIQSIYQNIM